MKAQDFYWPTMVHDLNLQKRMTALKIKIQRTFCRGRDRALLDRSQISLFPFFAQSAIVGCDRQPSKARFVIIEYIGQRDPHFVLMQVAQLSASGDHHLAQPEFDPASHCDFANGCIGHGDPRPPCALLGRNDSNRTLRRH